MNSNPTPSFDPRDIFDRNTTKAFDHLRLEQGEVLAQWFERRNQRDLVLKLNTGGGKTLVGLLACASSMAELELPAVYLVSDRYLVRQASREADRLGLDVTDDPRDPGFQAARKILIATTARLFNGRSTFGTEGGPSSPLALGMVVMDDAHAAARIVRQQFSAVIPRPSTAFDRMQEIFGQALSEQRPSWKRDLTHGTLGSSVRVPFWVLSANRDEVKRVIAEHAGDDSNSESFYSWPALEMHLEYSSVSLTHQGFEINPPCSPTRAVPSFEDCRRRLYMTATLAVADSLVTEFGAAPHDLERAIAPSRATDLGDRVVLVPQLADWRLDDDSIREWIHGYVTGDRDLDGLVDANPVNVIVLVPSESRVRPWQTFNPRVCFVGDLPDLMADVAAGKHLGLVVLVNKYDGVDLPNEACRILVIDGVQAGATAREVREDAALGGTDAFAWRRMQSLEQGMGRGVRNQQDYCAVVLLGGDLAADLNAQRFRRYLSPGTQAQVKLSEELSLQLRGHGLTPFREALSAFLARDPNWVAASRGATSGVGYGDLSRDLRVAKAKRDAFELAANNNFAGAVASLRNAADGLDRRESGWLLEDVAMYQHLIDPDGAQVTLARAREDNNYVLRPRVATEVRRARSKLKRLERLARAIGGDATEKSNWRDDVIRVFGSLAFRDGGSSGAEAAMSDLGRLLGFEASRPELETGKGPDVAWWLSDNQIAVIELKTEVAAGSGISKSDADQLSGSMLWARAEYGRSISVVPVMVHPSTECRSDAHMPDGSRVVDEAMLKSLREAVEGFVGLLAESRAPVPEVSLEGKLAQMRLDANGFFSRFGSPAVN